jgi:fibronectin-binding autotransporter adhesin
LDSGVELTSAAGGTTAFTGAISGGGDVFKSGAGVLILSGNSSYIGGTILSSGVLRLQSATAAGTGRITQTSGSSTLEIDTSGTLANDMSVYNLAFLQGATLSGNITVNNATFNVVENETSTISGAIDGAGGVTKTGLGQLTLSGDNTYTGATAVSAGVLELASPVGGAAALTSSVSVAQDAVLLISQSNQVNNSATVTLSGGTITRGSGVSEVFGNLNLTAASFLDFGTGTAGNLTFGTYQNDETPSALLTLNNFLPGNSLTFSSASFSQGSINSYFTFGTGFVDYSLSNTGDTFTITAIPEPSTYAAAAGLLAMMLWPARRRLLKDVKSVLGLRAPMRDRLARRASEG